MDGQGPLRGTENKPLDASSPAPLSREKITSSLALGDSVYRQRLDLRQGPEGGYFFGQRCREERSTR